MDFKLKRELQISRKSWASMSPSREQCLLVWMLSVHPGVGKFQDIYCTIAHVSKEKGISSPGIVVRQGFASRIKRMRNLERIVPP